jgi:hypothetical protein
MRLMGIKLHMTLAFHPQSDGQTEAANRIIVMYLRCFTGDRPRQWLRWLPWAEYTYNTAYQTSLRDTPFHVVYGRDPPSIRSYEPGETRVAAVAQDMEAREAFLADVRYRLEQAQASQKLHYDRQHRQVSYQVGDWALLRLRQRAASSLPRTTTGKLWDPTASSRSSTMSPFAWNCPRVPDFMMCSMLTCSRSSSAHRRPRHQLCRPSTTGR